MAPGTADRSAAAGGSGVVARWDVVGGVWRLISVAGAQWRATVTPEPSRAIQRVPCGVHMVMLAFYVAQNVTNSPSGNHKPGWVTLAMQR